MTPARAELHRILAAVMRDLQRDGYTVEQVGAAMMVLGLQQLFGSNKEFTLLALEQVRRAVAEEKAEWLQ